MRAFCVYMFLFVWKNGHYRYSDESKKTDITVWGYRNVWFRFEPHASCHQWEVSETPLLADGQDLIHSHLSPRPFTCKKYVFLLENVWNRFIYVILNLKDQALICWIFRVFGDIWWCQFVKVHQSTCLWHQPLKGIYLGEAISLWEYSFAWKLMSLSYLT